ncbi:MAG: Ig-like domain-containing protein [Candidatus Moranbacteria bacterium]|nr:Ig-like domain-containing protein [Candidatus Moranbacteria bacterium]
MRINIKIKLLLISFFFIASGDVKADFFDPSTIYSLPPAWGTGSLFTIDQDTWTETDEVPIYFADDPAEGVTGGLGLAVNPLTGEYYAIIKSADDLQEDPGYLVILDPTTGEAQRIGQFSTRINSLAFDSRGNLYGTAGLGDVATEGLFSIDISDASITKIMSLSESDSGRALAYNKDDGYLYYAYGVDIPDSWYDKFIDKIDISDPDNPALMSTLEAEPNVNERPISAMVYIGGGEFLAGDTWCYLYKIDVATGALTYLNETDECSKGLAVPWEVALSVSSLSPADNAENVSTGSDLEIVFGDNAYQGTGNIVVKKRGDDSVVETIDVSSSDVTGWGSATLSIDLQDNLPASTHLYVNIDSGAIKNADDDDFSGISDTTTWNFTTDNIIIETVPDGECYEVGSAEASQPADTVLEYSNDDQSSWTYAPVDQGDGGDCNVTDIRLTLDSQSDSVGEDLEAEFVGTVSDTEVISSGDGGVDLLENNHGAYAIVTEESWTYNVGYDIEIGSTGDIYTTGDFEGVTDFDPTDGEDIRTPYSGTDVFITKFNADGTYGWTRNFPGATGDLKHGMALDSSDNVYVGGGFQGTVDFDDAGGTDEHISVGSSDTFLTKYNSDGSYGWTITFGATQIGGVAVDDSDNIYITGEFSLTANFDGTGTGPDEHTSVGDEDIFITKYNSDGSYGWTRTFGGTNDDRGYGISIDSSGSVFATGFFLNTVDFDGTDGVDNHTSSGSLDTFITKYNPDGSYVWTRTFGPDIGYQIANDSYGNIFVVGSFFGSPDFDASELTEDIHTSEGYENGFITKYNNDGSYGWTRTFGEYDEDFGYGVATDDSGNVFITGSFFDTVNFDDTGGTDEHTSADDSDIFITKYDADGSYGWTRTFSGATGYDEGYDIATDGDNVFATGYFLGAVDFDDTGGEDIVTTPSNTITGGFIVKYANDGSYGTIYSKYSLSGTYETSIAPSSLLAWDSLEISQTTPAGTEIEYTILDNTCNSILVGPTTETSIDISSIGISEDELCLRASFSTTDSTITGELESWTVDYETERSLASFDYSTVSEDEPAGNSAPTDISLSIDAVDEGVDIGTVVGTLSTTDADGGDTHTYSFACATPGADDASFQISGSDLLTDEVFDYETKTSYAICIRADDGNGGIYDKNFTINITDVDENGNDDTDDTDGEDEDEDEDDDEYINLKSSKGGKLTFDVKIPKDTKVKSDSIKESKDESTEIRNVGIKTKKDKKVKGELTIKDKKEKPEDVVFPEEVDQCTPYQILDIDAEFSDKDIKKAELTFRVPKGWLKKYDRETMTFVIGKKAANEKMLEKNKWAIVLSSSLVKTKDGYDIYEVESESLDGYWGVYGCGGGAGEDRENSDNNNNNDNNIDDKSQKKKDIDRDGNDEIAIDQNGDISDGNTDGYEEFSDPDGSSDDIYKIDGDQDGQTDFLIDTDGDGSADAYWDPDDGIATDTGIEEVDGKTVIAIDTDGDGEFDSYYYPIRDEIREIIDVQSSEKDDIISSNTVRTSDDKMNGIIKNEETISAVSIIGLITGAGAVMASAGGAIPLVPFVPNNLNSSFFYRMLSAFKRRRFFSIFQLIPFSTATSREKIAFPFDRKGEDPAWGIVFDSYTKLPVPDALVQLVDKDRGKMVEQVITDKEGRYGFLIKKGGEYVLKIKKGEYEIKSDAGKDSLYGKIYSDPISLKEGEVAKINVALEAKGFNWDAFSENMLKRYHSFFLRSFSYFLDTVYILGFLFSIYAVMNYPNLINYIILILYIGLLAYKLVKYYSAKKFGTIIGKESGRPLPFAVIELYDKITKQRLNFTVSDLLGRYYLLADNGEYIIRIKYSSNSEDFEGEDKIIIKDGIFKKDLVV